MPIMIAEVRYGYSEKDSYLHRMYFTGGDNVSHLGGGGETIMTTTDYDGDTVLTQTGEYLFRYLRCLEEVVEPDVKIISAGARQFSDVGDWGSSELQFAVTNDFTSFTPRPGNTPKAGPRGMPFIGGRQPIAQTGRYGWMRWHYIAGNWMNLPALIAPDEISAKFASNYSILRNVGDQLQNYATLTGTIGVNKQITIKSVPSTVLHFGIRNG